MSHSSSSVSSTSGSEGDTVWGASETLVGEKDAVVRGKSTLSSLWLLCGAGASGEDSSKASVTWGRSLDTGGRPNGEAGLVKQSVLAVPTILISDPSNMSDKGSSLLLWQTCEAEKSSAGWQAMVCSCVACVSCVWLTVVSKLVLRADTPPLDLEEVEEGDWQGRAEEEGE